MSSGGEPHTRQRYSAVLAFEPFDLAQSLAGQGFEIDKRRIELADPIKVVGQYEITTKLVHGVTATFKVNVTREG